MGKPVNINQSGNLDQYYQCLVDGFIVMPFYTKVPIPGISDTLKEDNSHNLFTRMFYGDEVVMEYQGASVLLVG